MPKISLDRMLRLASVLCITALMVLSWTPGDHMTRTGVLTGLQEHFIAYLLTASVVALAITRDVGPRRAALALVAYAAVLELGQLLVPARDPKLVDFCASALGALVGMTGAWLVRRRLLWALSR